MLQGLGGLSHLPLWTREMSKLGIARNTLTVLAFKAMQEVNCPNGATNLIPAIFFAPSAVFTYRRCMCVYIYIYMYLFIYKNIYIYT